MVGCTLWSDHRRNFLLFSVAARRLGNNQADPRSKCGVSARRSRLLIRQLAIHDFSKGNDGLHLVIPFVNPRYHSVDGVLGRCSAVCATADLAHARGFCRGKHPERGDCDLRNDGYGLTRIDAAWHLTNAGAAGMCETFNDASTEDNYMLASLIECRLPAAQL